MVPPAPSRHKRIKSQALNHNQIEKDGGDLNNLTFNGPNNTRIPTDCTNATNTTFDENSNLQSCPKVVNTTTNKSQLKREGAAKKLSEPKGMVFKDSTKSKVNTSIAQPIIFKNNKKPNGKENAFDAKKSNK